MICEAPPVDSAAHRPISPRPIRTATKDRRDLFRGRWAVATAGTLMMVCLGTVYSWSIFARPLIAAFHWSATTTMWTFSTAIFALGIGAVVGGRIQDRIGPRNVALAGVVLWVFGTGPIRGFAIVLTLGIATSMFTALMGSRALITLMYGGRRKLVKLPI